MTLADFFNLLSSNPSYLLAYFALVPITALIGTVIGRGEESETVWRYFYSILIYLVAIPGIFAITLSIYVFFFERRSIFQTDILTQILPILSMIATLFIIKRTVVLESIPGFGKLSGFFMMVGVVMMIMWFFERVNLHMFSYMPVHYVFLILVGLLLVLRMGWSKVVNDS